MIKNSLWSYGLSTKIALAGANTYDIFGQTLVGDCALLVLFWIHLQSSQRQITRAHFLPRKKFKLGQSHHGNMPKVQINKLF